MIVAAPPRRHSKPRPNAQLVARTQALLTQEISFVPSEEFKRIERSDDGKQPVGTKLGWNLAASRRGGTSSASSDASTYLSSLCKTPLLTPEEERDCFRRMNYLKYRANCLRVQLSTERPNRTTLDSIDALLEESLAVRNRIVEANVRLVMSIVKQFADRRNRFDDLFSEGINCLVKAVEKFDFDRGFRFSTYATRAVRREIFRLVQRQHRDRGRFSTGSEEIFQKQLQREEHPAGVLATWGQLDQAVKLLFEQLDDREKFIVAARYGFDDVGEKPTFQRLGELLGVSKERARQLEQRALQKMRLRTDELKLEPTFDS